MIVATSESVESELFAQFRLGTDRRHLGRSASATGFVVTSDCLVCDALSSPILGWEVRIYGLNTLRQPAWRWPKRGARDRRDRPNSVGLPPDVPSGLTSRRLPARVVVRTPLDSVSH